MMVFPFRQEDWDPARLGVWQVLGQSGKVLKPSLSTQAVKHLKVSGTIAAKTANKQKITRDLGVTRTAELVERGECSW